MRVSGAHAQRSPSGACFISRRPGATVVTVNRRSLVVFFGLALGCGPAVDGDDKESGSVGSSSDTTSVVSTDDSDTSDTSDTDAGVCAELRNGPLPNLVIPIEITNTLATAVYVGYESACFTDLFRITRADGSVVNWNGRFCTPSCEEVMGGECFDCGACPENTVLRIGPGATYTYGWTPAEYDFVDFPIECAERACSMTCDRQHELADGEYTFDIVASTDCDGDGMTCDCGAGQETCEVYPWSWSEATLSASVRGGPTASAMVLTIE